MITTYNSYISYEDTPSTLQHPDAKDVWKHMYNKKKEFNNLYLSYLSPIYVNGIKLLNIKPDEIPTLSDFNMALNPYGWKALWIPGYVPGDVYCSLIASGYFPIAKNIRSLSNIGYSPIPDFIHDVWGHLPLIFDNDYSRFLKFISAEVAKAEESVFDKALYLAQKEFAELQATQIKVDPIKYIEAEAKVKDAIRLVNHNPSRKTLLSRIFLWTIEFGVIGTVDKFQILGAGILSSFEEALSIINQKTKFIDFDLNHINYGFDYFSSKQEFLFIASDIGRYFEVLQEFLEA